MLSELNSLNLKLCCKQYNKKFVLHLIVAPQLSRGWQRNYSTKTRKVGLANEQSMYSLISMDATIKVGASSLRHCCVIIASSPKKKILFLFYNFFRFPSLLLSARSVRLFVRWSSLCPPFPVFAGTKSK